MPDVPDDVMFNYPLSERMIGMCGFRNILIHQYQDLEVDLLHKVASEHWQDLAALCQTFGLKIVVECK